MNAESVCLYQLKNRGQFDAKRWGQFNAKKWGQFVAEKGGLYARNFQLMSIASQCPYKGGKAVYKSRALASLFNNQIVYDDQRECSLQGIYRSGSTSKKTEQKIKLTPNPANESVTVSAIGFNDGICRLQINNTVNQTISSHQFNCKDKVFMIDTWTLPPGIYTVHISIDNENITSEKLVVIR